MFSSLRLPISTRILFLAFNSIIYPAQTCSIFVSSIDAFNHICLKQWGSAFAPALSSLFSIMVVALYAYPHLKRWRRNRDSI